MPIRKSDDLRMSKSLLDGHSLSVVGLLPPARPRLSPPAPPADAAPHIYLRRFPRPPHAASMSTKYEKQRAANILKNQQVLAELGIGKLNQKLVASAPAQSPESAEAGADEPASSLFAQTAPYTITAASYAFFSLA